MRLDATYVVVLITGDWCHQRARLTEATWDRTTQKPELCESVSQHARRAWLVISIMQTLYKITEAKKGRKSLFRQCRTSIASITHRCVKLACSMGFSDMTARMVWTLSSSRDRKWLHVTKCRHSRVVGLRLEANLASFTLRIAKTLFH